MTAALSARRTVTYAIVFLLLLTLFRLFFANHIELVPDEAYYWEWGKHLDACYRDKGPAIGWTIAAGTWIAGDTVLGVRWLGVLLAAGTAWQVFILARRLFDDSVALAVLLISAIIPLSAVGSIIMTIDSLCVFFWAWSVNLAWTAIQTNRKGAWALLGFAIGCGFLAKFTNVLQLFSVFLFLILTPSKRKLVISAGTALMVAVFAITSSPILYWNWLHDWPNRKALVSRSSLDVGFGIHPDQLFHFLGEQSLVISPLLYLGMVAGVIGLAIWRWRDDRIRFLLCDCVPIYACFMFFSLNVAGKANWTAPALISASILMVVFWRDQLAKSRMVWIPVGLALFLAFAETALLHDMTGWLNLKRDPMNRVRGWEDLAVHAQKWETQYSTDFIIGNHYSQASILSFYLPGHPTTYTPSSKTIDNQYDLWPSYTVGPNTSALYVTDSQELNAVNGNVQGEFKHIRLLEKFSTEYNGKPVKDFQIYLCTNRDDQSL